MELKSAPDPPEDDDEEPSPPLVVLLPQAVTASAAIVNTIANDFRIVIFSNNIPAYLDYPSLPLHFETYAWLMPKSGCG
jgi:hypothetical protein